MLDILEKLITWRESGTRVAVATLIDVVRSAPRDVGATLAVNDRGDVIGSLSGGCVESSVYLAAVACLAGEPPTILTFGLTGEEATESGLTCGGAIRVLVRALQPADDAMLYALRDAVARDARISIATRLDEPERGRTYAMIDGRNFGTLGSRQLDRSIVLRSQASDDLPFAIRTSFGSADVFVQSFSARPDMFVFGAVDFARAMATIGRFLGYRVTVVDARPIFATAARIPDADRIIVAWPDEFLRGISVRPSTALVVLTHDEKFDIPLLAVALRSRAGYIGVMGSRPTHARRVAALRDLGVPDARIARLHGPIGLDIGARNPEETAISIASEIVAARNGRSGASLRSGSASLRGPLVTRTGARRSA